jgi:hypothetical protein
MNKFLTRVAIAFLERRGYWVMSLQAPTLAIGGGALASTSDPAGREWFVTFMSRPFLYVGGNSAVIDTGRGREPSQDTIALGEGNVRL